MKPLFTNLKLITMKKIYLMLAMLAGFFGGTTAFAQSQYAYAVDEDDPLILDASQLSSPWTDPDEGKIEYLIDGDGGTFWHSSWHSNPPHNVMGSHYLQVELTEDFIDEYDDGMLIAFKMQRRNTNNNHPTKWAVYGTNDEELTTNYNDPLADQDECEFLAEFETPLGAAAEWVISAPFDPMGFRFLRFYVTETKSTNGGESNATFWHAAEFQLYPAIKQSDWAQAMAELEDIVSKYTDYYDEEYFPVGENPGDFNEDLVQAFLDAYEAADDATYMDEGDIESDEIKKLGEDLIAAYDTIWTSRVPIVLESGYYRFRTAVKYYQNVKDPVSEIEEPVYSDKYMRAALDADLGKITGRWGTPDDMMMDASALWKVTRMEDGRYDLFNMGYDMRIDTVSRSATVTLSEDAVATWRINAVYTNDDDETLVNIRILDDDTFDYLHQCDHNASNGEGNASGSRLVGWTATFDLPARCPGASEWIPELVSDDEAEEIIKNFAPYKDREAMLASYDSIMTNAKTNLTLAKDMKRIDLITKNEQLSSPCSDSAEGQHIEYLIDGDASTFWHTDWHSNYTGTVHNGLHYLQVQLDAPVGKDIYLDVTRRDNADNDHPTKWVVFGGADPESVEDDDWTVVDTLSTPYGAKGERVKSAYFNPQDFTTLRIAPIDCAGASYGFRTYWHSAEIQLAYEEPNPNAQANFMGEVVTNLENIINAQADVDSVTVEMYDALKDAYDAFMAKFVDPTVLRDYLSSVKGFEEKVVVGTDPGFWTSDADAKAFKQIYDNAVAYDEAGAYVADKSNGFIDQLKDLVEKINSSTIPVQTGKWYRMRFATEEFYEEHEWDKLPGGEGIEYSEQIQARTSDYLWGKYAAAGDFEVDSVARTDGEEGYVAVSHVVELENEKLGIGSSIMFFNDDDLTNKDMSYWRFIALGDTAFIMQNKATGMFLNAQRVALLSAHPSMFQTEPAGYGMNYIKACSLNRNDFANNDQDFLHAQVQYNLLVHYNRNSDWDNKRCRFYLEEVGDVEPDFDGTTVNVPMRYGSINTYCFPVEMTQIDGQGYQMWGLDSADGNTLNLMPLKSVQPGRPFIVIYEDTASYNAEEEPEMVPMKKGYDLIFKAQDTRLLKGTFEGTTIKIGSIVADGNKFSVTKAAYNVSRNSAFITMGDSESEGGFDRKTPVTIVLTENEDAIQTALANVSKAGAVYTIDGRLVSKKATLNDLNSFGKGVYILNGTKVIVK